MASGEWIGCFCLSEPNAGSDAGSLTTFAEDKGDHWEINGVKNWITNGKEASICLVFAKTKKLRTIKGYRYLLLKRLILVSQSLKKRTNLESEDHQPVSRL